MTNPEAPFRIRTRISASNFRGDSTACDTGFVATTSRPDSLLEISRSWIFEEGYFLQPNSPLDEIQQDHLTS